MGGHGGLNILPQKRWNVYNFDNREKVEKDEEEHAKKIAEEKEQKLKKDGEARRQLLLEKSRKRRSGELEPASSPKKLKPYVTLDSTIDVQPAVFVADKTVKPEKKVETVSHDKALTPEKEMDSSTPKEEHINLFEGFIKVTKNSKEEKFKRDGRKKSELVSRIIEPGDEIYRLGYGLVGSSAPKPWYLNKKKEQTKAPTIPKRAQSETTAPPAMKKRKSIEELRDERAAREEKERLREAKVLEEHRAKMGFADVFKVPRERTRRFNSGYGFGK